MPVKILIAEDHMLIAEMWHTLLSKQDGYQVQGKYGKIQEVIDATATLQPDILLLDIALADGSGLDIIPRLKKASPGSICLRRFSYSEKSIHLGCTWLYYQNLIAGRNDAGH